MRMILTILLAIFLTVSHVHVQAGGAGDGKPIGTAVLTAQEELEWWNTLKVSEQSRLVRLFEPGWYTSQPQTTQIAYAYVAQTLFDFLSTPGIDSRTDDSYISFAPLMLRASFHAAGT